MLKLVYNILVVKNCSRGYISGPRYQRRGTPSPDPSPATPWPIFPGSYFGPTVNIPGYATDYIGPLWCLRDSSMFYCSWFKVLHDHETHRFILTHCLMTMKLIVSSRFKVDHGHETSCFILNQPDSRCLMKSNVSSWFTMVQGVSWSWNKLFLTQHQCFVTLIHPVSCRFILFRHYLGAVSSVSALFRRYFGAVSALFHQWEPSHLILLQPASSLFHHWERVSFLHKKSR